MTDDTPRRPTLADVPHTNPNDDGDATAQLFGRGPRTATDGGGRDHSPALSENGTAVPERRPPTPTLADVSHTPPYDSDANGVWKRGPVGDE